MQNLWKTLAKLVAIDSREENVWKSEVCIAHKSILEES